MSHFKILLAAALAATFSLPGAMADAPRNLEVEFVQLDLDSDGFVAMSEWKGGAETFGSLDRNGDAVITRNEFFYRGVRYQTRDERFRELDANRDGKIGTDEWKWGEKTLAVLDRDGDGALSRQEFGCRSTRQARQARSQSKPADTGQTTIRR